MTKDEITEKIIELDKQREELVERLDVLNKPSAKELRERKAKQKNLLKQIKQAAKSKTFVCGDMKIVAKCDLDWDGDLPRYICHDFNYQSTDYEHQITSLIREYEKLANSY